MKTRNNWLWQPPGETIDTIANVLGAHWTAAKSQQMHLFSLRTGHWLQPLRWRGRITTLPVAASSSGRLPDPHPC